MPNRAYSTAAGTLNDVLCVRVWCHQENTVDSEIYACGSWRKGPAKEWVCSAVCPWHEANHAIAERETPTTTFLVDVSDIHHDAE